MPQITNKPLDLFQLNMTKAEATQAVRRAVNKWYYWG